MSSVIDLVRKAISAREGAILHLINPGRTFAAYEEINRIASEAGQKRGVDVGMNFRNSKQLLDQVGWRWGHQHFH